MAVKLDRTMYRKGTNGALHVAPGRQLYVLQPNGSLNRTVNLATETLVEGFTDEALSVSAGTGPFSANSDGQFGVWFPTGTYDLYAPADETNPLTRWQPVAALNDAITLAPTTSDRNLLLAPAGVIPATLKVPSALPALRLYSDGGAAQPTGNPKDYGSFELNNHTTIPNDIPGGQTFYHNKPTMLFKTNDVLKFGIGFDVGQGRRGGVGDRRDDLAIYHWDPVASTFRDVIYITDEPDPATQMGVNAAGHFVVGNPDKTRPTMVLQHNDATADLDMLKIQRAGVILSTWWSNGWLTLGGANKPASELDVRGEAFLQRLRVSAHKTAFITGVQEPLIYSASGAGAAPFDQYGNLFIQPRGTSGHKIVFATNDGVNGLGPAMTVHGDSTSNVEIHRGDQQFAAIGKGPVVRSPDGTRYRIVVANGGALSTVVA